MAQDQIPKETHYSSDRTDAYHLTGDASADVLPVQYSLEYTKTTKRFITEVNDDNTTSLIFGNGILRSGQNNLQTALYNSEHVGIIIPNKPQNLEGSLVTL